MDGRLVQDPSVAMTGTTDIFEKCFKFNTARQLQEAGVYPFFRVIESAQDPEVFINGKKMKKRVLCEGDIIRIGTIELIYISNRKPEFL